MDLPVFFVILLKICVMGIIIQLYTDVQTDVEICQILQQPMAVLRHRL